MDHPAGRPCSEPGRHAAALILDLRQLRLARFNLGRSFVATLLQFAYGVITALGIFGMVALFGGVDWVTSRIPITR